MIRPRRGLCIPFTLAVGEPAQPLQRAHPIAERKADQRQVVVGCPTARKLRAAARACPASRAIPRQEWTWIASVRPNGAPTRPRCSCARRTTATRLRYLDGLVAGRGRLLARVEGWPSAAAEFTRARVERTRSRAVDALQAAGRIEDADALREERNLDRLQKAAAALAEDGSAVSGYLSAAIRRRQCPGLCAYVAGTAAPVACLRVA